MGEIILKAVKKIAAYKCVKAIYLFGSYTRNEMHLHSDIDLCVIADKENVYLERELMRIGKGKLDISLFCRLPLPIRFRVFREGKLLYIKDRDFVDKLKIATFKGYLDIKPLINRYIFERFKCTI
jgi:predicted nucleotidyltransferase